MKLNTIVILLLVMSMFAFEAQAQRLYKWVDAHGVTHYGETLPSKEIDHVAFDFTEDYQVPNSQEDYYSIQNQLKRLQQRRSQERAEKLQSAEDKSANQQTPDTVFVQVNEPERRYYSPAYFPRYTPSHFDKKYNRPYPKQAHQQHHKSNIEKPRSGITHKTKVKAGAAFSASR